MQKTIYFCTSRVLVNRFEYELEGLSWEGLNNSLTCTQPTLNITKWHLWLVVACLNWNGSEFRQHSERVSKYIRCSHTTYFHEVCIKIKLLYIENPHNTIIMGKTWIYWYGWTDRWIDVHNYIHTHTYRSTIYFEILLRYIIILYHKKV